MKVLGRELELEGILEVGSNPHGIRYRFNLIAYHPLNGSGKLVSQRHSFPFRSLAEGFDYLSKWEPAGVPSLAEITANGKWSCE